MTNVFCDDFAFFNIFNSGAAGCHALTHACESGSLCPHLGARGLYTKTMYIWVSARLPLGVGMLRNLGKSVPYPQNTKTAEQKIQKYRKVNS